MNAQSFSTTERASYKAKPFDHSSVVIFMVTEFNQVDKSHDGVPNGSDENAVIHRFGVAESSDSALHVALVDVLQAQSEQLNFFLAVEVKLHQDAAILVSP